MSQKIELEECLKKAEGMYMQLRDCKHLPSNVAEIVGLTGVSNSPTPTSSTVSTPSKPVSVTLNAVGEPQVRSTPSSKESSPVHTSSTADSSIELINGFTT